MSKKVKGIISLILSVCMIAGMLPVGVVKTEAVTEYKVQNPAKNSSGDTVWDYVWFGSYPQAEVIPSGTYTALDSSLLQNGDTIVSDTVYGKLKSATLWSTNGDITIDGAKYRRIKKTDAIRTNASIAGYNWSDSATYHYFKYEPIKWRVLQVNGDDAFLLADKGLDLQRYNMKDMAVTWETSTIRSWLNGYDASSNAYGTDYSNKNFINAAFSTSELSAIKTTTVINSNNLSSGTKGGNNTKDKIFLLSQSEVYMDGASSYGFDSKYSIYDTARECKSSTYAKAMGTNTYRQDKSPEYWGNCEWLLRSPGIGTNYASLVKYNGYVDRTGYNVVYNYYAARPALHLNLASFTATKQEPKANDVKKPKASKIKKLKKATKSLKVSWKKVSNVSGYQIQYSTSSKFKKAKKITIKKAKTTSKTIKKLKAKKKYYVRIRTYITINSKKKYSNWSKKKSQKTK